MRPTFLGLEIAKRGAMVSQKGLDIVGHNIMNTGTPGYTRQRLDVYAVAPNTATSRYGYNRTYLQGQGVDAGGVSQIRDAFLDKRFREEYGSVGYYDKCTEITQDIESVLDEFGLNPDEDNPSNNALQNAMQEILDALSNMSGDNADSTTHATITYTAFKNMTMILRQMDNKLKDVADQAKYDLNIAAESMNANLQKIAKLNESIRQDMAVTQFSNGQYYGPNELMDQRNLLIDELSSYGDVSVEPQTNGTVTIKMNGHTVVEGQKYDQFVVVEDDSIGTVALKWQTTGKDANLTTGSFKAALDMINGRGPNAHLQNEVTALGVRYYQDKLDAYATTLFARANEAIPMVDPATGEDIPGEFKQLLSTTDAVYDAATGKYVPIRPVKASNITVSKDWTDDNSYIIYKSQSTQQVPLVQLKNALQTGKFTFKGPGDISDGLFTGTFNGFVEDYTATLATNVSYNMERLASTSQISLDLQDRRDEISGVSQDEETTQMIAYSRAFQAAGRLMTALDEALDVLINKTGLVGR